MGIKIGFYGDSFCADWGNNCWTTILCEKLNADYPISLGTQGSNCWTYFKKLKETVDQIDIAIICHTQEDTEQIRCTFPSIYSRIYQRLSRSIGKVR